MSHETRETAPPYKSQLWILSLSAILTEQNKHSHNTVIDFGTNETERKILADALKRDWGVSSGKDMRRILKDLKSHGHNSIYIRKQNHLASMSETQRTLFIQSFQGDEDEYSEWLIIQKNLITLDRVGIAAWDEGRYVSLCRSAIALNMFSEQEAWDLMAPLAKRAQAKYDNWHHYATSYIVGRQYWRSLATKDFLDSQLEVLRRIFVNPALPWNTLPWDLPLDEAA
jgi:hypothetical protein